MLDVVDLDGKIIKFDGEYLLTVQAVVRFKPDDDYIPTEYSEEVSILDEDEFELESLYLNFKPLKINQDLFATSRLTLDNQSQLSEFKYLEMNGRKVEIQKLPNDKDLRLATRIEKLARTNNSSNWIPSLAGKIMPKSDEVLISVKGSICPQPDEDEYTPDSYFEEVKILDDEGYELESAYLDFKNTQPLKVTQTTDSLTLYDVNPSQFKYISLFDVVVPLMSKITLQS